MSQILGGGKKNPCKGLTSGVSSTELTLCDPDPLDVTVKGLLGKESLSLTWYRFLNPSNHPTVYL